MMFPDVLKIRVIDQATDLAISYVALMLTIFARRKNDYHFPVATRTDGFATITVADIRQSISEDQKLFLMDYASDLDDCKTELQIDVCAEEEIQTTVDAMEKFKSVRKFPETIIDEFRHSVNKLYHPTSVKIVLNEKMELKVVDVYIRRRAEKL